MSTQKRYTIRRPGCTSWAETNSWNRAQLKLLQANQVCPGHIIVDNSAPSCPRCAAGMRKADLGDYYECPNCHHRL